MGSIAMDKGEHCGGLQRVERKRVSCGPLHGTDPTDPLGTLEGESSIQTGAGSQLPNLSCWGDYSSMSVDPVEDCTFWYTSE